MACTARLLSDADLRTVLYPIIQPFLKMDVADAKDITLLGVLKAPVS